MPIPTFYPIINGPSADSCRGCESIIPPGADCVMRHDAAKFCSAPCIEQLGDKPLRPRRMLMTAVAQ